MDKIPFLEMFPCCESVGESYTGLGETFVTEATVRREDLTMEVRAFFPSMPAPVELSALEWTLRREYGLRGVTVDADWPKEAAPAEKSGNGGGKASAAAVLYGKRIKGASIPISEASPEMKTVTVSGRVFAEESRDIPKRGAYVLQFDMSDGSGSVRVSKYFPQEEDSSIRGRIKPGMYVTVSGSMKFNKFSQEVEL